jgi:tetratricopeptide (TPR) repeat protein
LQLCRTHGYTDWAIFPLITLAIALQLTGQRQRTRQVLTELCALAQPGSAGVGYAGYVAGMLALDEDDFSLAETEFETALTLAEQMGDPSLNLDTRLGISRRYHRLGDQAKAMAWAEDALNFARRVGYRIYQGRALLERGRAGRQNGSLASAEDDLLQAEAIFTELEMRCDLVEVRLELVAINLSRDDARTADLFLQVVAAVQAGGYAFLLHRERALVYPLIARFLSDPDLPLAGAAADDEPSLGLAPLVVQEIFRIIKKINEEQEATIILVEQNARMALQVAHYGYVMENGKIMMEGKSKELSDNPDI